MIFEDKLIALIKNPGYTISQGYRLYEVDPFGLMYFNVRCTEEDDPAVAPGTCSSDSKRSLDNYSYFNDNTRFDDDGLYNFANPTTETIIDIYIDQANQGVIFVQVDPVANNTKFYISPFKQIERRTVSKLPLPSYFLIGVISGHQAVRTIKHEDTIYTVNAGNLQTIYKVDLDIKNAPTYGDSNITATVYANYMLSPELIDITYDQNRGKVVALRQADILIYDNGWEAYPIPTDAEYVREHKSITHDYVNDLYIIGNLSGVGSAYDFRGPTRSLIAPDNILNKASAFTILAASDLTQASEVPYFTVDNIETYRYPLIFPLDNPNQQPTLPYKTYCNLSKIRFYEMNGIPRIIARDDFIYVVLYSISGEIYPESSYIHRTLLSYSSYIVDSQVATGVLSTIAVADKQNAVSTDPNEISQWLSFDYAPYVDPECSKVLVNNIKICHERAAKCVGSASLIKNGDFLEGLTNWTDLDGNVLSNPYDPDIWTEDGSTITLETVIGIKQDVIAQDLIDIRIKINSIEPVFDGGAGVIFKFYDASDNVVYEENVTLDDLGQVPGIFVTDFAIGASSFSIELNDRATKVVIDYILICDIAGEKSCEPGFEKISYDSFIDNNGLWVKESDPDNNCGIEPPPPPLPSDDYDVWYDYGQGAYFGSVQRIDHFGYENLKIINYKDGLMRGFTIDKRKKRVFYVDQNEKLHRSSQANVNDDVIIAQLPNYATALDYLSRNIAYDDGHFVCVGRELSSPSNTLILLNDEGSELKRTSLGTLATPLTIQAVKINQDIIYLTVNLDNSLPGQGFRIYKYDLNLQLLSTHTPYFFSVIPALLPILAIDPNNKYLYYGFGNSVYRLLISDFESDAELIISLSSKFSKIWSLDCDSNGDLIILNEQLIGIDRLGQNKISRCSHVDFSVSDILIGQPSATELRSTLLVNSTN